MPYDPLAPFIESLERLERDIRFILAATAQDRPAPGIEYPGYRLTACTTWSCSKNTTKSG